MPARFHALPISEIEPLSDDSFAVTFDATGHEDDYAFAAGQHVSVRVDDEVRRSYSIVSPEGGALRIGVKVLPAGHFSAEVLPRLRPGDALDVLTPAGRFGHALAGTRRPVFVGAGSGVTPLLSMAATTLARDPEAEVGFVLSNRTSRDVMFLEDLADLKNRYLDRFQLVHVLTREPQESELLSGRLSPERLLEIRKRLLGDVDGWFLCGPQELVATLRDALAGEAVHTELFHASPVTAPVVPRATGTALEATLAGRRTSTVVQPGEHVLDAMLRARGDAPYACKGGVCGTCRARVVAGEVTLDQNWALEPDELAAGYVLTCQARPVGESLEISYDA